MKKQFKELESVRTGDVFFVFAASFAINFGCIDLFCEYL